MYYEDTMHLESTIPIIMIGVIAFLALAINLIGILIACKIFSKAGYHWACGLLMLVPVFNFFVPFFLAFADWPVQRELRALRQQVGAAGNQGAYGR